MARSFRCAARSTTPFASPASRCAAPAEPATSWARRWLRSSYVVAAGHRPAAPRPPRFRSDRARSMNLAKLSYYAFDVGTIALGIAFILFVVYTTALALGRRARVAPQLAGAGAG